MKYICTKCKETMELSKMTVPIAGMTPEAQRVREVGWDDYYGTDNYSGYREKEQSEINKKYKKK